MLIFLVVTRYRNGYRDERAFSSHLAARAHAACQECDCEVEILEVQVMGALEEPDLAYTIRWYDITPDTHNIEVVYGTHRQARLAVGNQGYVQELRIETDLGQADGFNEPPVSDSELQAGVIDLQRSMSSLRRNRTRRERAELHRLA